MSEVICPSCRTTTEAGAAFCGNCGARMAPTGPQPAPQAPPQYGAPQYQAPSYQQQQVPPGYGAPGYPYGAQPMPGMAAGYLPAGFGVRIVANLIDGFLLYVAFLILLYVGAGSLNWLVSAAYCVVMWVMQGGATVGKKAMGLRVISVDGKPLDWGRAVIRYVLYFLAFTALFDDQKRGLHDKVAKTMVVKKA